MPWTWFALPTPLPSLQCLHSHHRQHKFQKLTGHVWLLAESFQRFLPHHLTHVNAFHCSSKTNGLQLFFTLIFFEKLTLFLNKSKKIHFYMRVENKSKTLYFSNLKFFSFYISIRQAIKIDRSLSQWKWFEWSLQSCGVDLLIMWIVKEYPTWENSIKYQSYITRLETVKSRGNHASICVSNIPKEMGWPTWGWIP